MENGFACQPDQGDEGAKETGDAEGTQQDAGLETCPEFIIVLVSGPEGENIVTEEKSKSVVRFGDKQQAWSDGDGGLKVNDSAPGDWTKSGTEIKSKSTESTELVQFGK